MPLTTQQSMSIVTAISEVSHVTRLPRGAIVGDLVGGRSFNDNIAAALERRSHSGWVDLSDGEKRWTLILIESEPPL